MSLLKRVLPFILTLTFGAMLVLLFAPAASLPPTQYLACKKPHFESAASGNIFRSSEVTEKAKLLSKPAANYTMEARQNGEQGTVRLSVVLASSGEVTNVRVISGLPFGLSEQAVAAARQIEFTPAMKDGRAVSQYVTIEYVFNLY